MTIALLGFTSIYNGFQKFINASLNIENTLENALKKATPGQKVSISAAKSVTRHAPQRALRVLRVSEQGQTATCAGRMVISGRMADVCAELDRLVALEAQKKTALPH